MKQITRTWALAAATVIVIAGTPALYAGSCVVPDLSKWKMRPYTGTATAPGGESRDSVLTAEPRNAAEPADAANVILPAIANVPIAGLWKVTYYDDSGNVSDVAFDAWHADGLEVLNDYSSPILGNVCLGVFKATGVRTYRLYHPSWLYDNNGNLTGLVVIHETVTVDRSGNNFSGPASLDFFDTAGNALGTLTGGRIVGTRIQP